MTRPHTERVLLDLARAYGAGPVVSARMRFVAVDDCESMDAAGLSLCVETETLARAGSAVALGRDGQPKDPELRKWWTSLSDETRQELSEWDSGQFRQEGRGVAYRVREFNHWTRTPGVVLTPESRPKTGPLLALCQAHVTGMPRVLEDWLLCVALQDAPRWELVAFAMTATEHEAWAVEEAGYSIVYGLQGRVRDRARLYGVRAERYLGQVTAAREVLLRWLDMAAEMVPCVAGNADRVTNFGDLSGHPAETWWRPEGREVHFATSTRTRAKHSRRSRHNPERTQSKPRRNPMGFQQRSDNTVRAPCKPGASVRNANA